MVSDLFKKSLFKKPLKVLGMLLKTFVFKIILKGQIHNPILFTIQAQVQGNSQQQYDGGHGTTVKRCFFNVASTCSAAHAKSSCSIHSKPRGCCRDFTKRRPTRDPTMVSGSRFLLPRSSCQTSQRVPTPYSCKVVTANGSTDAIGCQWRRP